MRLAFGAELSTLVHGGGVCLAKTDVRADTFIFGRLAIVCNQDICGYVVDGRGCILTKAKADAFWQIVDAGYKPP